MRSSGAGPGDRKRDAVWGPGLDNPPQFGDPPIVVSTSHPPADVNITLPTLSCVFLPGRPGS